mgnify:CR=1 FL=1
MKNKKSYKISMAAAKLTQSEVAEKMQVSKQTIVNWENGKIIPGPAQFAMFCDICEAPKDAIFLPRT